MPTIHSTELRKFIADTFTAAGALPAEGRIVSDALVDANLAGHDSHGVMRAPFYIRWMEQGLMTPGAKLRLVTETESLAVFDGGWGFGQIMGQEATRIAIGKARKTGSVTVSGRNFCHMGRLGDYPAMAAREGMVGIMFINTHGGGRLVAPFGGVERRLSANPIAIAVPRRDAGPIIVDISTCKIAEGKIRNMQTANQPVPEGCIIDADGNPTTDADAFYGPPPGALLPIAEHKGYGLGLIGDILAGALSGAGCSRPGDNRIGNSFLMILVDIERVRGADAFGQDVDDLVEYVKSSRLAPGVSEILTPGEPEERTQAHREKEGIPIHETTWEDIVGTAKKYGVTDSPSV